MQFRRGDQGLWGTLRGGGGYMHAERSQDPALEAMTGRGVAGRQLRCPPKRLPLTPVMSAAEGRRRTGCSTLVGTQGGARII